VCVCVCVYIYIYIYIFRFTYKNFSTNTYIQVLRFIMVIYEFDWYILLKFCK